MSQALPIDGAHSPRSELAARLRRERALIALFDFGSKKGFGLWVARLYAFGVFAAYAIAIAVTNGSDRRAVIHGFVHAALVALSWVVGALAALGTARVLAQSDFGEALRALALQRGFSPSAILRAQLLASALRVARLVGVPALLLVLVAVLRGQSLAWLLVTAPAVAVYAALLGAGLALLAAIAARLSARHPRALLAALVLAPWLISQAYPAVPTLSGVFALLLDGLLAAGAALS